MSKLGEWTQLVVGALTALSLGGGGFLAVRRWLKGWVAGVAADSREAARQLTTSNGTTVAQYVERTDKQLNAVSALAQDSSRRADTAVALAEQNSRRLDEHLLRDHQPDQH